MAPALSARRRGFTWPSWLQLSWSWRITWLYLALVLFLPLGALALKAAAVGPVQFWQLATSPEALATYRISFGLAFVAALLNGVFGLVIAWALVRCSFPGRRLLDSLIDLPFALPTAVAGLALAAIYSTNGWLGAPLAALFGIKVSFTWLGVAIAMVFISLPFVVRSVEPVLEALEHDQEEAAWCLGATPRQTLTKVVLPQLMGRGGGNLPNGQAGGFLGKAHDPFALMADPSQKNFKVPDLLPPDQIGAHRLERRRKMRDIVESSIAQFEASEDARLMDENFHAAFRIMTSQKAREAFDLTREPLKVRERYGMNRFGQCCLLARRLVESGVRFVTINTFLTVFDEITWDIHGSKPFTSVAGMKELVCPMYDQAYSALIEDLSQRGMLEDTLVANLSEFGRTPKINPAGGRDHWPQCFTTYFAGGGVKGGRVVGASDPIGGFPAERPVNPGDIVATIFHSLGLNHASHLPGPGGRPFTLTDLGTEPIRELFT